MKRVIVGVVLLLMGFSVSAQNASDPYAVLFPKMKKKSASILQLPETVATAPVSQHIAPTVTPAAPDIKFITSKKDSRGELMYFFKFNGDRFLYRLKNYYVVSFCGDEIMIPNYVQFSFPGNISYVGNGITYVFQ